VCVCVCGRFRGRVRECVMGRVSVRGIKSITSMESHNKYSEPDVCVCV